jgi:hypothetical protein
MKINRRQILKYSLLLICLTAITYSQQMMVAIGQEHIEPITKDNLVSSIKLGKRERKTVARYIKLINRYGVDFSLTPEIEQEIRREGEYLGKAGIDKLVDAVHSNYRPDEPTEEEIKETLIRIMEKKGGQRKGNTVEFSFFGAIAGIKIENFKKIGCAPVDYNGGYYCTYHISSSLYATEERIKLILEIAGIKAVDETLKRRFVWSEGGWLITD